MLSPPLLGRAYQTDKQNADGGWRRNGGDSESEAWQGIARVLAADEVDSVEDGKAGCASPETAVVNSNPHTPRSGEYFLGPLRCGTRDIEESPGVGCCIRAQRHRVWIHSGEVVAVLAKVGGTVTTHAGRGCADLRLVAAVAVKPVAACGAVEIGLA